MRVGTFDECDGEGLPRVSPVALPHPPRRSSDGGRTGLAPVDPSPVSLSGCGLEGKVAQLGEVDDRLVPTRVLGFRKRI